MPYEYNEIGGSRAGSTNVAAASVVIIQANTLRKEATFTNDLLDVAYLTKGPLTIIPSGIPIFPRGSVVIKPDNNGYIYKGPISVATFGGTTSRICWTEDW